MAFSAKTRWKSLRFPPRRPSPSNIEHFRLFWLSPAQCTLYKAQLGLLDVQIVRLPRPLAKTRFFRFNYLHWHANVLVKLNDRYYPSNGRRIFQTLKSFRRIASMIRRWNGCICFGNNLYSRRYDRCN